jgi:hypothetical protein
MTTQGCSQCPDEGEVRPVRNIAIIIVVLCAFVVWVLLFWTPFIPIYFSLPALYKTVTEKCGKVQNADTAVSTLWKAGQDALSYAKEIRLPQLLKIYVAYFQVCESDCDPIPHSTLAVQRYESVPNCSVVHGRLQANALRLRVESMCLRF